MPPPSLLLHYSTSPARKKSSVLFLLQVLVLVLFNNFSSSFVIPTHLAGTSSSCSCSSGTSYHRRNQCDYDSFRSALVFDTQLFAKKSKSRSKNKSKNKKSKKNKKDKNNNNDNDNRDDQFFSATTISASAAPQLAGIVEDNRHEQFFYQPSIRQQLYQLVQQYSRPVLLCNPSLALEASKHKHKQRNNKNNINNNNNKNNADQDFLLLDIDTRFEQHVGSNHYQYFDVTEPSWIAQHYDYDAVFIDPPFANVTPQQLVDCVKLMGGNSPDRLARADVYVGYNAQRQDELLTAFRRGLPEEAPTMHRLWKLEYQSPVIQHGRMKDSIYLFGPDRYCSRPDDDNE